MKIEILPIVEKTPVCISKKESTKPIQATLSKDLSEHEDSSSLRDSLYAEQYPLGRIAHIVNLNKIFAEFIKLEVGDGAASPDTIRNYISHTKQYFNWCRDNLLQPLEAVADDIKQYRKFLIDTQKKNKTIATKLNIIRRLYQAAIVKGLISTNPVDGIKAPVSKEDPASRITFLSEEELALLLGKIQSQLDKAKTQKQRLTVLRDRILISIMSLEGCRTIEMHSIKIQDIVKQGNKCGLRVSAKRSTRIVPLTDNLRSQLEEYLEVRGKVLRRKIKPKDNIFISFSNNSKGKQLSRRGIRAIVDRYLEATKLKHTPGRTLSAHSLRHTAGTLSMRAGADLRQVQDLLGHADPRTTSIYAHVGDRWEYNPGASIEEKLNLRQ
jgi:site-specific recombinase XerD